jgi:hypothetical protein
MSRLPDRERSAPFTIEYIHHFFFSFSQLFSSHFIIGTYFGSVMYLGILYRKGERTANISQKAYSKQDTQLLEGINAFFASIPISIITEETQRILSRIHEKNNAVSFSLFISRDIANS